MAKASNGLVVAQAVARLKEGIENGQFVPGQRLIEADLMGQMGCSRDSIREALRQLAAEGLVVTEAYKGASVRRLGRDDIREIFEMREVLEGKAAALAACAINKGSNRKKMLAALERNRQFLQSDDMVAYGTDNRNFHDVIVNMANNERLKLALRTLLIPIYRWQFQRLLMPNAKNQSIEEHVRISEAILEGDEAKAEMEMREHVQQSGRVMQSFADKFYAA